MRKKGIKNILVVLLITLSAVLLGATSSVCAQSVEENMPLNEIGFLVLYFCIVAVVFSILFLLWKQKKEKKFLPWAVVLLLITVVLAIVFWLVDLATYGSTGIAWWNWIGLTYWGWMLYLMVSLAIFLVTVVSIYVLKLDKEEKLAFGTGVAAWIIFTICIYVCSLYLTYAPLFS